MGSLPCRCLLLDCYLLSLQHLEQKVFLWRQVSWLIAFSLLAASVSPALGLLHVCFLVVS